MSDPDTLGSSDPASRSGFDLERIIDVDLLLKILFVGVPVLLTCIISSAG